MDEYYNEVKEFCKIQTFDQKLQERFLHYDESWKGKVISGWLCEPSNDMELLRSFETSETYDVIKERREAIETIKGYLKESLWHGIRYAGILGDGNYGVMLFFDNEGITAKYIVLECKPGNMKYLAQMLNNI